jgi:adenine-specific DNA-methyltransferase
MALLQDLIQQIDDPALRERILQETDKLVKQKKFGLVFEEHLPECTPLYDVSIRVGSKVAFKKGCICDIYIVLKINGEEALCDRKKTHEQKIFRLDELVTVAQFGEAIYPTLKQMDCVENAPDSDLWHTLIEADNYHALQLLEYLYAGKVDCIYIDPPYNTGARDWKYNNDYVDSSDAYRHSKWLSMMEKRLKLAKKLLNPEDSVLIVTIDEKEYLHLGCLLEELFPESRMQMISTLTNSRGVARENGFARVDEYIFVLQLGVSTVCRLPLSDEWRVNVKKDKRVTQLRWSMLIRSGSHFLREDSVNQFYPIYVYDDGKKIHSVGDSYYGNNRDEIIPPDGTFAVWPLRKDGVEGNWQISSGNLKDLIKSGFVRLGRLSKGTVPIYYLKRGEIVKVKEEIYKVSGHREDGSIISDTEVRSLVTGTQWKIGTHDASTGGTNLLKSIFGSSRFTFPKSLYAVHDTIRFFVANKPNSLIVDFFAGSGTTMHAVNLLNAEDNGHRRCIMVTNNEVSDSESKSLKKQDFMPGDDEWEKIGIARNVTWPRTVCSITGHDINDKPLKGNYFDSDIAMAEGFKANAAFLKLSFLDKTSVALGIQFKELIPVLWMKGGSVGKCPVLNDEELPDMLILSENKMAILIDEIYYPEFDAKLAEHPEIITVFIITDSESAYREMIRTYDGKDCYQLYRDYLDNFRINIGR